MMPPRTVASSCVRATTASRGAYCSRATRLSPSALIEPVRSFRSVYPSASRPLSVEERSSSSILTPATSRRITREFSSSSSRSVRPAKNTIPASEFSPPGVASVFSSTRSVFRQTTSSSSPNDEHLSLTHQERNPVPTGDSNMGKTVYRKDYLPPSHWIRDVHLTVRLHLEQPPPSDGTTSSSTPAPVTEVEATLRIEPNAEEDSTSKDLILNGDRALSLEKIAFSETADFSSAKPLDEIAYSIYEENGEQYLKISANALPSGAFFLRTTVRQCPQSNKSMMGLYTTQIGDTGSQKILYTTQMEAEGFRKLTYFLDRPDVMSRYVCRIEAPKSDFPVLLSNGNEVEKGELEGGRHFAVYEDPFNKPSYLFALVAGELGFVEKTFTTKWAKRDVSCRVYAEKRVAHLLDHALDSLLKAMKFDEDFFGLEYDLDVFNIVSVKDFNMGAMENKSLNIFNEKLILASRETATDGDYDLVESVVAHEYFHNWTGNRVTCRDWFQLTLKEGLTVFRDQTFSITTGLFGLASRIDQVEGLKRRQFAEDAGPLSHPVRPDEYEKIDNFYTATVYQKGAEVIRMYWTILGEENFKKGLKLYIQRWDGQATTCDEFRKAMADASGVDLTQFSKWLSVKGTPVVTVTAEKATRAGGGAGGNKKVVRYTFEQSGVAEILHIPIKFGVIGRNGDEIHPTDVLHLKEQKQTVEVDLPEEGAAAPPEPVLSVNRNLSAPINVRYEYTLEELAALAAFDTDVYTKFEAFKAMSERVIKLAYQKGIKGGEVAVDAELAAALEQVCGSMKTVLESADAMTASQTVSLPDVGALLSRWEADERVDPLRLAAARVFVKQSVARSLDAVLRGKYKELSDSAKNDGFSLDQQSIGSRRLRNVILGLLEDPELAKTQYEGATNMTEKLAAFSTMVFRDGSGVFSAPGVGAADDKAKWADALALIREDFLRFAKETKSAPVVDKWFAVQASTTPDFAVIRELAQHEDFELGNPNRFRSLVMGLTLNPELVHSREGYGFLADMIGKLDQHGNAQVAARVATFFQIAPRLSEEYRGQIVEHIKTLLCRPLSAELVEILSKIQNQA